MQHYSGDAAINLIASDHDRKVVSVQNALKRSTTAISVPNFVSRDVLFPHYTKVVWMKTE